MSKSFKQFIVTGVNREIEQPAPLQFLFGATIAISWFSDNAFATAHIPGA